LVSSTATTGHLSGSILNGTFRADVPHGPDRDWKTIAAEEARVRAANDAARDQRLAPAARPLTSAAVHLGSNHHLGANQEAAT